MRKVFRFVATGRHPPDRLSMPSFSGATAPGKAFSVAPAPVPKLGCVGQTFVRTSPRNFSSVGNEILEGYARGTQQLETSARKTIVVKEDYGLTTGALLDDYGPCPPEILLSPSLQGRPQTSIQQALARYQDLANENAQTGAWAPNTKKAPPLLRMDTKRYDNSSPRLHSPGHIFRPKQSPFAGVLARRLMHASCRSRFEDVACCHVQRYA